jgi:hypothetical protein
MSPKPQLLASCVPILMLSFFCDALSFTTPFPLRRLGSLSQQLEALSNFQGRIPSCSLSLSLLSARKPDQEDFLDVDFEPVWREKSQRDQQGLTHVDIDNNNLESISKAIFGDSKNLIDLSFETADSLQWKKVRVPFCQGEEYIDGKLAFMVEFEGQSYGIAVPFDDAVALVYQETVIDESNNNHPRTVTRTSNISPEMYGANEEYAELMEIFAAQVQEQFGEEYQLRKTPKVLTISGGLEKITKDWEKTVVSKPVPIDDLLNVVRPKSKTEVNQGMDEFYEFMRQELGDEEFEKTMNGEDELSKEDLELLKYFEVPKVLGENDDNSLDGYEELLRSISIDLEMGVVSEADEFKPNLDYAALKILGYTFTDTGKSYFLVKPLKPITLVGRHMKDEKDCIRFQLLSTEEEKVILPKLEKICQEELEANGLTFPTDQNVETSHLRSP